MQCVQKSKFNFNLYLSLLVSIFVSSIYTTLRIFFLGNLPSSYAFSIASQLVWINLIYEIIQEAIILPLFYFVGQVSADKMKLAQRVKAGLLFSACTYSALSALVFIFVNPLLHMMAAQTEITAESAVYIRIEAVANIFSPLVSFLMVVFTTLGKKKYIYFMRISKTVLRMLIDTFLVSTLPFSLKCGINGIGFSNIISSLVLLLFAFIILHKEGIHILSKSKPDFSWLKEFSKVGGLAGVESFVRNVSYMFMVCRMTNVVGEQGTYWVASSFIWSWLLVPINALCELVKKEVSSDKNAIRDKTKYYFIVITVVCCLWFISIPLWKPFFRYVLFFDDVDKLFPVALILAAFYVTYAYQTVFDMTFYGMGKTDYMLFESVATNIIYYGVFFVLFKTGVFVPTLNGIAVMFGAGCAFDAVVSLFTYLYFLRKLKY